MNRFAIISLLLMLWGSLSHASGVGADILWAKGTVLYGDQEVIKGLTIPLGKILRTSKSSFVKVRIPQVGNSAGVTVVLGPQSELKLESTAHNEKSTLSHQFITGAARFIHEKSPQQPVEIHTANASVGVRGTEYILKVNPALGESEIVLFEGKVEMGNLSAPEDHIEILPGQWGGLGGRFGAKFQAPITLPAKVYAGFKKLLAK